MTQTDVSFSIVIKSFLILVIVTLALPSLSFATPALVLSGASGPPTSNILVSGSGFAASTAIDIYFDSIDLTLAVTNSTGSFTNIAIEAPSDSAPGNHWVTGVARGSSGSAAQAPFLVRTNWMSFQYSSRHKGFNPYENVLGPGNVGSIDVDWKFTTDRKSVV